MSPPNDPGGNTPLGGAGLLGIFNTLQTIAQNIIQAVIELKQLSPIATSGQLSASKLVIAGFVRVTGISVVKVNTATPGGLYDANTIAGGVAATQVYSVPAVLGYYPLQLIFANGLVYVPGTSEIVTVFYVRA